MEFSPKEWLKKFVFLGPTPACWLRALGRETSLLPALAAPPRRGLCLPRRPALHTASDGGSCPRPGFLSPPRLWTSDTSLTSPRSIPAPPGWWKSPLLGSHGICHPALVSLLVCCLCPQTSALPGCRPRTWELHAVSVPGPGSGLQEAPFPSMARTGIWVHVLTPK